MIIDEGVSKVSNNRCLRCYILHGKCGAKFFSKYSHLHPHSVTGKQRFFREVERSKL